MAVLMLALWEQSFGATKLRLELALFVALSSSAGTGPEGSMVNRLEGSLWTVYEARVAASPERMKSRELFMVHGALRTHTQLLHLDRVLHLDDG
ncbi:hypothetical protein EYF80_028845 [Liparis tanakae]|uniref:Uncharacterized protein n=1 Tax=Liparis tanakae TaxID=230148 RepID=A0A4Z2H6T8_9TELE|nr:hypothetical protein EYF80_028845 [Liparis tanakae]